MIRLCILLVLSLLCCQPIALAREATGEPGVYSSRDATLSNILEKARAATANGDHAVAAVQFRQAAELAIGADTNTRATIQFELGNVYRRLNQQEEALGAYEQGLNLLGTTQPLLASKIFNAQGISYRRLGRYAEAIDSFQHTILLRKHIDNPLGLAEPQANLGGIYQLKGYYAMSLSAYRQALALAEKSEDPPVALRANLLTDIGLVLTELGDFGAALKEFEAALQLLGDGLNPKHEGRLYHNMAFAYFRDGDLVRSVEFYNRALVLRRQADDRRGESKTLNGLGFVQAKLGQNELALKTLEEALAITRELGDQATEGRTLDSIATVYMQTDQHRNALEQLHLALAIKRVVGDLGGEHVTLANIGRVYHAQDHHSLAILFLKQSVNVTEKIRSDLTTLPRETRQAYTETVADTYRLLANLLIGEGRLPEAQQVLAMLKEEEYHKFIRRGTIAVADSSDEHLTYSNFEQEQLGALASARRPLTALEGELRILKRIKRNDRTDEQKARIIELQNELDEAYSHFQTILDQILSTFDEIENSDRRDELALKQLDNDLRDLVEDLSEQSGEEVAVIHYLMLGERLHILLTTRGLRLAQQVAVDKANLYKEIQNLRDALQHPHQDPTIPARALHDRLIGPIKADLEGAKVKHLMFYLDGALRYLPLATLHDGEHYLLERYSLSVYTAAAERNLKDIPRSEWSLAGLGLSQAYPGFQPLPAVPMELEGIVKQREDDSDGVLAGIIYLDQAFTKQALRDELEEKDTHVLHIASHFVFRPGTETDSFLLIGDGSKLDLGELRLGNYRVKNVDLLTLSACETAIGGHNAEGEEVEGFATLTQKMGAKGVLATLWPVVDASTGMFMQHFYWLLTKHDMTKAEALRQTQLAFLSGEIEGHTNNARGVAALNPDGETIEAQAMTGYRHPYYWAPFILMGNWL